MLNDAPFLAGRSTNTVNVPVYINEYAQYNRVFIDVNKISTVFGRDNFEDYISNQIKNNNLVRIKNRSIQSSERNALIAKGYREDAPTDSISQNSENATSKLSLGDDIGSGRSDIYGKDISLDAPIREDITSKQKDSIADDLPIREDVVKQSEAETDKYAPTVERCTIFGGSFNPIGNIFLTFPTPIYLDLFIPDISASKS